MKIYSDYNNNKTIEIDQHDLDLLIERGYVYEDDGKYFFEEDKYWTIQQMVGNLPERKSHPIKIKKLNETGEWTRGIDWLYVKENPDDDSQEANWIRRLADDLEYIISEVEPINMKIEDIHGFDMYQGPYAFINIEGKEFKVWTTGYDELYIEDFPVDNTSEEGLNPGFQGYKEIVSDVIKMWVDDKKHSLEAKSIQKCSDFLLEKLVSYSYWFQGLTGEAQQIDAENKSDAIKRLKERYGDKPLKKLDVWKTILKK